MSAQIPGGQNSLSTAENEIRELYRQLLDSWNRREGKEMASFFSGTANLVGFDGSQVNGRAEIEAHVTQIFRDHQTAPYISKVREVRFLTPEVAVLCGVVGMIPPGQTDLNPDVNAIQTLVALKQNGQWRVEVFQNTPAAFHGQPELSQALTDELRQLL